MLGEHQLGLGACCHPGTDRDRRCGICMARCLLYLWKQSVFCDLTVFQTWKCCALSRTKLLLSNVMLSGGCIQLFHLSASWLQRTMCTGESQPGHVCITSPFPSAVIYYEKPDIHQGLVRFFSHFQTGSRNSFSRVQAETVSVSEIPSDASLYQKHMIMENTSDLYYLGPLSRGFLAICSNKFPVDSLLLFCLTFFLRLYG